MPATLPAIFFGHGNPMNALQHNPYTEAWKRIGEALPRPRAVLSISAHWFVPETGVTVTTAPRTIHDFGGFPGELYQVKYPAPGDPALARRVQKLLAPLPVNLDETWGLDHGTWSVLCHVYPQADVSVVQLSIDATQPASFHYEIGKRLAPLRDEGVLIAGSGNLVHNLRAYAWGQEAEPLDWALRFEDQARQMLLRTKCGRWLNMKNWAATRGAPSRRPTTTCLCCTWRPPGSKVRWCSFPWKELTAGQFPCWPFK